MFKLINLKRLKKDLKNKNLLNIKKYKEIIKFNLKKLILIIGPCSVSNIKEILNYSKKIKKFFPNIDFLIRIYYEKPRSNIGWKGYIYDPYIDNSYCIIDSFYIIRRLLLDLLYLKINIATECLNFYLLNFFIDCIIWICIGARTMHSQIHREFCSGINNIIGIKNDTLGNIVSLNDSYKSIINKHCYINFFENKNIFFTNGNYNVQYVLRGHTKPNFIYNDLKIIKNSIIIDCSHSNSMKNALNQFFVFENVFNQFKYLKSYINGFMFESYQNYGNQNIKNIYKNISITDSCINFNILKKILILINNEYIN
ncbi:3-deoxy-7-phosphoheptulonate synthase [Candidatus Carsonella ruddii]|uniref:3-deoxy-7-phosphoheptulonate synthase n=1 Tax=Carsonella ruddii TaxID=114186 RepID=UPI003D57EABF